MKCIPAPRLRFRHFLAKVSTLALLTAPVFLQTSSAYVSTITVPIETSDQTLLSDGSKRALTEPASRVGAGYSALLSSDYVMSFKLPSVPAGERIVSATLSVNLEGWDNRYSRLRNIDLYGIQSVRVSGSASQPGDFVNGANPGANAQALLLQDNFLSGSVDAPSISAPTTTNPKQTADFGSFVQTLYDNGGTAGKYGFLVLAHDTALNELRYFTFTSANTATSLPKPFLTVKTEYVANVPRDYYLDGSAATQGLGTALSPFNSFNALQPVLKPGDTVHCTGTFGVLYMFTSTGTHGLNPYAMGTVDKPISYKCWEGRSRPQAQGMVFDGVQKQTYLSFDHFIFSPSLKSKADYATGSYATNSTIRLSGAWHITFTKCVIAGPALDVGNLPPNNFAPYVPSPRDTFQTSSAITSGYPRGDASWVTIKNCRIKNSGIGINVYEHAAYAGAESRYWTIQDNDIRAASEDGLRFSGAGDAGKGSIVKGNTIREQDGCQAIFAWYGYAYKNGMRDSTAFDGKEWPRVTQTYTATISGTATTITQTAVVYCIKPQPGYSDGYARIYVYPDNKDFPMIRSAKTPLVMSSTDSGGATIEFRPLTADTIESGTLKPGVPASGDNSHTDGISIMATMTGGLFDSNRVDLSQRGGGGLKMENIPLRKVTIVPTGTTFSASGTTVSGTTTTTAVTVGGTTTTTTIGPSGTKTAVVDNGRVIYSGTTTTIAITTGGTTATFTTGTTVAYENHHPTNIIFKNNLFGSSTPIAPAGKSALFIIAGGKNCWFIHNTIFGGIFYNPDGSIRFSKDGPVEYTPERNAEFKVSLYNNFIGGSNASGLTPEDPKVVSKHNVWMRAPSSTTIVSDPLTDHVLYPNGDAEVLMILGGFTQDGIHPNPPGDLHINAISPAIDRGLRNDEAATLLIPSGTNPPIPDKDINGYARGGSRPDSGAYEFGSPSPDPVPDLPEDTPDNP